MRLLLQFCLTLIILKLVTARNIERFPGERISTEQQAENAILLSKVVRIIVDEHLRSDTRRAVNSKSLAKAMRYYEALKNKQKNEGDKRKQVLRASRDEQAMLVESELKTALSAKKSSLYDKPFVKKEGKNDYLVMRPEVVDPFVTIVPNHIYYDAEKKCVNWLDDCSLRGIREKLLRGIQSPLK